MLTPYSVDGFIQYIGQQVLMFVLFASPAAPANVLRLDPLKDALLQEYRANRPESATAALRFILDRTV
jgi:hypothetical protein